MSLRSRSSTLASFVLISLGLLVAVDPVAAHEEYVVEEERNVGVAEFFADAVADPLVVGPLLAGAVIVAGVVAAYLAFDPAPQDVAAFRYAMREYVEYVPWLLRISVGIPLIGAGFEGYFFSPAVEIQMRLLQVALGFLLLFGLATRAVALVTLAVYLAGAVVWPTLLLQLEFVGATVAIAIVGSGKPSADHVLARLAGGPGTIYGRIDVVYERARRTKDRLAPSEATAPTVVRVGLGATFVFLGATQKLLQPGLALAVVDRYDLTAVVPASPELWVLGAGLAEVTLGLALIVGAFTRAGAAVAIAMFSLTLFALPDDPVLAHVVLFGMASVLLITGGGPYSVDNRMERLEDDLEATVPSTVT
ncbi:DoxX family protein [Natrialbaceae archaeon AArc-T1-2]|uniref:DoxX family protein n=1 Tax=Natrialbaceae archaeon AArc-T1-2 TaxID=3053904 RepID=UPI00255AF0C5|nr:DoxX family protein [Natrialbaceae archaeon AArc-T1-2]WIV67568.1 DoxX family protein [Natrialbaceae archaeon AArc-T1-2]